jgi:3D (Asp-Asp-Asp) domain-containing protein
MMGSNINEVQVTADGKTTIVNVIGGTVADVLEKIGVELGEFDETDVALTEPVTDGLSITVERVEYEEYTETETVSYDTTKKYTNSMAKGKTELQQAGQNGEKTLTYRRCYRNGEFVGTELVDEEITVEPVDAVYLVGTTTSIPYSESPYDILLDSAGQPLEYSEVYTGRTTAYTSESSSTSIGMTPQVGVVAVDPNIIPYGTELYIVSPSGSYVYGYAIAGDTGSALRNGDAVVDLFYNTTSECFSFGARTMNVYVIG